MQRRFLWLWLVGAKTFDLYSTLGEQGTSKTTLFNEVSHFNVQILPTIQIQLCFPSGDHIFTENQLASETLQEFQKRHPTLIHYNLRCYC